MEQLFFERNRSRLLAALGEKRAAVFCSNPAFSDLMQPAFRPYLDRNFYYLTGLEQPGLTLFLSRDGCTLYTPDAALAPQGVLACEPEALWENLRETAASGTELLFFSYGAPEAETTREGELARRLLAQGGCVGNSFALMAALRASKTEEEIFLIAAAARDTGEALAAAAAKLCPGMYEYEALAEFDYSLAYRGLAPGFQMAANGANALQPHYLGDRGRAEPGSLMLFDVGSLRGCYTCDISRTYPVDGRFTPLQRALYETVLAAQAMAEERLVPGTTLREIDRVVRAFYARELAAMKLPHGPEDIARYYPHGLGHPLGLYVHDPGSQDDPILANGVYTLEPGLYLPEYGIGIRIEDDYAVSPAGAHRLSAMIPRSVGEVEHAVTGEAGWHCP